MGWFGRPHWPMQSVERLGCRVAGRGHAPHWQRQREGGGKAGQEAQPFPNTATSGHCRRDRARSAQPLANGGLRGAEGGWLGHPILAWGTSFYFFLARAAGLTTYALAKFS